MDLKVENRRGRKPVPEHMKRVSCHSMRLSAWVEWWLKEDYPGDGPKMTERALLTMYKPDEKEVIKRFYEQLYGVRGEK